MDALLFSKFVASLILPPAGPLLLGWAGLMLWRWRPRVGRYCLFFGLALLTLVSTPWAAHSLQGLVQEYGALDEASPTLASAGAIVVLGGGRYRQAPEYGGVDTASPKTLVRLRYAAYLQRMSGLPVLVTGGMVDPQDEVPEARFMAGILENEFGATVRWREEDSRNTAENAAFSAKILRSEGIHHIVLITHASHMARSVEVFLEAGLDVTPAPTALQTGDSRPFSLRRVVPQAWALYDSRAALHELLGMLYYRIRY